MLLLRLLGLLNIWHVEACRVLLNHTAHAKGRRAGADSLFHDGQPAMWQAVGAALEVRGNDLVFQHSVEREAVRFVLRVLVVIFALLADGPAVHPVIAFVPPT